MRNLRFALIPAVLFLLPGLGQAVWFWQNPLPQGNPLWPVCFVDNNNGYAAGCGGTILKTTDGGTNWVSQTSGTNDFLSSVYFPVDALAGYAVGRGGTILKTTDGGQMFVEEQKAVRPLDGSIIKQLKVIPNPFTSFARIPGHSSERFNLYDISGRRVGTYKGDRIGEGLAAGVYFLRSADQASKPLRIVKIR